jgi:outer membrane lipoprotein-sorting protein
MNSGKRFVFAAAIALALFAAAPAARAADTLQSVLDRLDKAAANFHTTSADFVFDTETVEPIADTEIQKGVVYYQRGGPAFRMAAHINEDNGHPMVRVYTYANGLLTYYDAPTNQVTRLSKAAKFESYLMLGFGASGKDLAAKWDVTYLGSETIDGVQTAKLELVAKDPEVRKNLAKVTIWVDPDRAVSLRQRFDESSSVYRICTYTHIRINQTLPRDAFTFKTAPNPTYINR